MGYFLGIWGGGGGLENFLGSTYVVEQISFSMFLSILTFEFDLILGSFLNFWGPKGLFLKTVLGSTTHVVVQISFSIFL